MKQKLSRFLLSAMAVFMLFSLVTVSGVTSGEAENPFVVTAQAAAKKIGLNKTKHTLTTGATYTLKLLDKKGKTISASKVKWSTSSKKVVTVSSKGAIKGVKKGTATVTAKYKGKKYTCKVTVKNASLSAVKKTLTIGDAFTLTLKDANGKKIDAKNIKWSSADKSVASVSSKGVVKALKKGAVKITAKYKNKKYTCTVTAKKATLSASKKTLAPGGSFTLVLKDASGKAVNAKNVKWSSNNKSVATVSSKGVVKAVKNGSATITATYKSKKYTCKITVAKPQPTSTLIYQDSNIKVNYYKIERGYYSDEARVYFKVYNKTSQKITIQADAVSLNGYCFNDVIVSDPVSPKATGIVDIKLSNFTFDKVNINNIKYVGVQLRVISDAFRTYDACSGNKSLYGKADLKTPPAVKNKKLIFSDANLNIYFDYAERYRDYDDEVYVYLLVQNKKGRSILVQNDDVVINGTSYSRTIMSDNTLPYSTGHVSVKLYECYESPSSINTVGGTFRIIDERSIGRTYDALMGTFGSNDPWADAYGEAIEDNEDTSGGNSGGSSSGGSSSGGSSTEQDNKWSYSEVLKINEHYIKTKGYANDMYRLYQKSADVNNLTMKKTNLALAKGYADLGRKQMLLLISLCESKAPVTFKYGDGTHSSLTDLAREIYDEFNAIALLEVTEETVKDCEKEIGRRYITILAKFTALTSIYSGLIAMF